MNKKELRLKFKRKRQQLSEQEIEEKSLQIANNLLRLQIWSHSYYHLFLSISEKNEVDTQPLLHILQGKDKSVVLSKSDMKSGIMKNFLLTDSTRIKKNAWGVPEPVDGIEVPSEKIEVVFLPLLAFDEAGNRIGYGKGFYDRFLSECSPQVLKIGMSLFEAEPKITDVGPFDIPLDLCVTSEKIYNFKNL